MGPDICTHAHARGTHTHTHTHTHTRTRTCASARAHAHARTHACTHGSCFELEEESDACTAWFEFCDTGNNMDTAKCFPPCELLDDPGSDARCHTAEENAAHAAYWAVPEFVPFPYMPGARVCQQAAASAAPVTAAQRGGAPGNARAPGAGTGGLRGWGARPLL